MSRVYRLVDDMNTKEKAVGGLLTFGQAGWIILGLLIFGILFVSLSRFLGIVLSFVLALIPGAAVALPFAFYEKGGLSLSSYLVWRMKFSQKSKDMINTYNYRLDRPEDYEREQGGELN